MKQASLNSSTELNQTEFTQHTIYRSSPCISTVPSVKTLTLLDGRQPADLAVPAVIPFQMAQNICGKDGAAPRPGAGAFLYVLQQPTVPPLPAGLPGPPVASYVVAGADITQQQQNLGVPVATASVYSQPVLYSQGLYAPDASASASGSVTTRASGTLHADHELSYNLSNLKVRFNQTPLCPEASMMSTASNIPSLSTTKFNVCSTSHFRSFSSSSSVSSDDSGIGSSSVVNSTKLKAKRAKFASSKLSDTVSITSVVHSGPAPTSPMAPVLPTISISTTQVPSLLTAPQPTWTNSQSATSQCDACPEQKTVINTVYKQCAKCSAPTEKPDLGDDDICKACAAELEQEKKWEQEQKEKEEEKGKPELNAENSHSTNVEREQTETVPMATTNKAEDPAQPCIEPQMKRPPIRPTSREIPPDGYSWRKYGSKHLPNSLYPKSYFRCSVPSCKAKRYITEDENGVLHTEYIGVHNHTKYINTSHNANTTEEVCRLAALGQNFLIKTDISFPLFTRDFPELASFLHPCIINDTYLILNGFGFPVINDTDKRYDAPLNIINIPTDAYPLSMLITTMVACAANGWPLEDAYKHALSQVHCFFCEQTAQKKRLDYSRYSQSAYQSYSCSSDMEIRDALVQDPRGRKVVIICRFSNYRDIETDVDFFKWKKYGHKPQREARADSKAYYRCTINNCPARKSVTYIYKTTPEGSKEIDYITVQYDGHHLHRPDSTRATCIDCYSLLKIEEPQTAPTVVPMTAHHPVGPAGSSCPIASTVTQHPPCFNHIRHQNQAVMQNPIVQQIVPIASHKQELSAVVAAPIPQPATMSNTVYRYNTQAPQPFQQTQNVQNTQQSSAIQPTQIVSTSTHNSAHLVDRGFSFTQGTPSMHPMHRIGSFEQGHFFFFSKVDSGQFSETLLGLNTEQGTHDNLPAQSAYGASYTFAAPPDYSNYGLMQTNSFIVLNHLSSVPSAQPGFFEEQAALTAKESNAVATTSPGKGDGPTTTNTPEHDTLFSNSAANRNDKVAQLPSLEIESTNHQHDGLMNPLMNLYIHPTPSLPSI